MKVKSVRYFKTRRGLGYEAKTDKGTIWNDGNGGGTYFDPDQGHRSDYQHLTESDLEAYIDVFEEVK